jgi:transcriptional regulator with XRE-family HTH domain
VLDRRMKPISDASAKLGAHLQQLRSERKLTMRALAARARVDFSYIGRLERGQIASPSALYLWRVARALGVEVADLYLEAGFGDAHGLPGLRPYLRAKYHLPDEAIRQLEEHFALINERYQASKNAEHDAENTEAPNA